MEDEEVAGVGVGGEVEGGRRGEAGVDDGEDEVGGGELGVGAGDAGGFDGVAGGGAEAGGVDEAEGEAVEVDDFLDGVAGGAGEVADDGALEAQQLIEEAAFAGVGSADEDGAHAFAEEAALVGGGEEGVELALEAG